MADFKSMEKKWQERWEKAGIFKVKEDLQKKKFYCLEMFPYPSGSGLHMGHVRNYAMGDCIARFKRMHGFNVLYPMGYDAFGLPAENAAIKNKTHPKAYTENSMSSIEKNQRALGLSYDWTRKFATCYPEYYKWNQWFFLQFLKSGLAYKKEAPVNWCPKCTSVLANEQVEDGKCWRCESLVEEKRLEQWFFRITKYADRLLKDLGKLEWPEKIKKMQENWIGKSEGTEIFFKLEDSDKKKEIQIESVEHFRKNISLDSKIKIKNREFAIKEIVKFRFDDGSYYMKLFLEDGYVLADDLGGNSFILVKEKKTNLNIKPNSIEFQGKKLNFLYNAHAVAEETWGEQIFPKGDSESFWDYTAKDNSYLSLGIVDKTKERLDFFGEIVYSKDLKIVKESGAIPAFTTRPDTIFSVTFLVLAPEHPLVLKLVKGTKYEKGALEFMEKINKESLADRTNEAKEKEGYFIGKYAINPASKEKIPVWIANFAIMDYGTGAVMCDAHDKRDFKFARKYGLPLKFVITAEDQNCIIVHGSNSSEKRAKEGKLENLRHWKPWLKENLEKYGVKTSNELYPEDWLPDYGRWKNVFEKNTITENTTLVGHSAGTAFLLRWLSENKKKVNKLILVAPSVVKTDKYKHLSKLKDFNYDSSLKKYFNELVIFYSDNDDENIIESAKDVHFKLGGDLVCIKGQGHFCYEDMHTEKFPELLEAILGSNEAFTEDGILFNSGQFDGLLNREALPKISDWLVKNKSGKKVLNYKIRDWLISRQRYWGTPIPVVYCGKCGVIPVPEKDLPVLLPEKAEFTGQGNPLANTPEFVNTKCPQCGGKARRETDTMDTFVDSSWYFLRFCNPNFQEFSFDKKAVKYWMTVDQYIGGAEHAVMHLLYARFFTKALKDMGLVGFDEPFARLFNQGILYKDGHKMSKSFGNVVTQEEMSEKYGIDTARLFLLFVGSPEKEMEWSDKGVEGVFRFVNRVYRLVGDYRGGDGSKDRLIESKMHRAIKQVTETIENFEFNKSIGCIMGFVNSLNSNLEYISEKVFRNSMETLSLLLSPFAPHLSEEIWERLGNKGFVSAENWPKSDLKKINEEAEYAEDFAEKVLGDIKEVLTLLKIEKPKQINVFVADGWKYLLFKKIASQLEKTHNPSGILKEVMKDTEMKKHGKDVPAIVVSIAKDPSRIPELVLSQKNELEILMGGKGILEKEFGCKVEILPAGKSASPRARKAGPGKPGIEVV